MNCWHAVRSAELLAAGDENRDSYHQSCSASAADVLFCRFALETISNIFAFSLINILCQNLFTQKAQLNSFLDFSY